VDKSGCSQPYLSYEAYPALDSLGKQLKPAFNSQKSRESGRSGNREMGKPRRPAINEKNGVGVIFGMWNYGS
jgi:hypothetical protein